jgi:hypothetical protein
MSSSKFLGEITLLEFHILVKYNMTVKVNEIFSEEH